MLCATVESPASTPTQPMPAMKVPTTATGTQCDRPTMTAARLHSHREARMMRPAPAPWRRKRGSHRAEATAPRPKVL